MKTLTVKFTYLPLLLLLLLWCDHCESLTDSGVPSIFFPFGTDEGDSVLSRGSANCQYVLYTPYSIFAYRTLNVSYTRAKLSRYLSLNVVLIGKLAEVIISVLHEHFFLKIRLLAQNANTWSVPFALRLL